MKTLTAPTLAAAAALAKSPLWLVEIGFDIPVRLCSWGTLAWAGQTWTGADLRVGNIETAANGGQGGQIEIGNTDLAWSALILADGIADRAIRVWQAYFGALADADPIEIFAGAGDAADIRPDRVSITLASEASLRTRSPRETGGDFAVVMPVGFRIAFNGELFELARD